MFKLNGKKINLDRDLTIGEGDEAITYPSATLRNKQVQEALGIEEVADGSRPDDRLFYVTEKEDGTYDAIPRPKSETTGAVWEQLKVKRDSFKDAGVLVDGKWFHTDADSRIQHLALTIAGTNIPAGLQWKTMDGSFIEMTPARALAVFQACIDLDFQAFSTAEQHKVEMEKMDNPFEYDFSTGWPATYQESISV